MQHQTGNLRVILTPDGFYPQALRWQGYKLRVLFIEGIQTFGPERRYRVRTAEGPYELGLQIGSGIWQVRRSPSWLDRARARLEAMPRYPLPAWRRRRRPAAQVKPASSVGGGEHANRLALVRQ
jgi:hypothetical protein